MELKRRSLRRQISEKMINNKKEYENNYTLNVEKTLGKKLESTKRTSIAYRMTNGGLTAELDAVSFELFTHACEEYYDAPENGFESTKSIAKDKKGNMVQNTYHIRKGSSNYTLNMYITRCSLLINGKNINLFIEKDMKKNP